jgi:hypothetical protein
MAISNIVTVNIRVREPAAPSEDVLRAWASECHLPADQIEIWQWSDAVVGRGVIATVGKGWRKFYVIEGDA